MHSGSFAVCQISEGIFGIKQSPPLIGIESTAQELKGLQSIVCLKKKPFRNESSR
jgi:hypothetical protein